MTESLVFFASVVSNELDKNNVTVARYLIICDAIHSFCELRTDALESD